MRLDERERPSCVKEAEVKVSITFAQNDSLFRLALVERN